MSAYDYVIAGGGAAGCVLAARLSETAGTRVLLLEAGPEDKDPYIHMPVGFYKMTSGPLIWSYNLAAQRNAANRRIPYAQGRVLGGGSSINAMVFTRGQAQDFDHWSRDCGCDGWSFQEILPYYRRSEDNNRLAGEYHGTGGPLGVSDLINPTDLARAFVLSCQQMGMPYNPDFNGAHQEGCGLYQVSQRNGRRSSAVEYLRQARNRSNLHVLTGCLATRIRIENGSAVGVEYQRNGRLEFARAEQETIVSSGAIGSPKLLMLSGIGPADELKQLGIPVVQDVPGVGRNLHDHYDIDIIYDLSGPHSLDRYKQWHWMVWAGLEYKLFNKGPVTSNVVEGGAFWYGDRAQPTPDLQFHFLVGAGVEAGIAPVPSGSGCTMNSYFLRPRSRGTVKLLSADPAAAPSIDPNYLADPYDLKISVEGLKVSREIMAQSAFRRYIRCEHLPGPQVRTQAECEEYARQYGRTSYHPVGTCRMGADEDSVVDPKLRVRGVNSLRVIDSSIMPSLTSSNTFAPTVMIAEKGAHMITGKGVAA
ncbi:MAG: GMC family oxidoreductase N-terminal domain-containing protein [Paludibaculum sp.]